MPTQASDPEEPASKEISDLLDQLLKRAVEDAKLEGEDHVESRQTNPLATPERRTAVPKVGRTRRPKKP